MKLRLPIVTMVLFFFILIGLLGASDLPISFAAAPQLASLAPTATLAPTGMRPSSTATSQPKISSPPPRSSSENKSPTGNNVWASIGPQGEDVRALAIHPQTPSTLYAGTYASGVFKSTNAGVSWNAINTGLTNTNVVALAIEPLMPSILYAGGQGSGVFKSTGFLKIF